MDPRKARLTAALCASLAGWGCNQSSSFSPSGSQKGTAPSTIQSAPDRVIADFLEAVRIGDDKKAADLLTPLARQKTSDMQMVVAPPGSDTAKFQVQDVELIGDGAQVATDWTDLGSDGRPHTDRIVWILRQTAQGWRIAGMATRVFADQEPIVLNFEDPADMISKQQLAEEEIARRDRQQPAQAKIQSAGDDSVPR
jgi:ketosteroid isomerase-like protein